MIGSIEKDLKPIIEEAVQTMGCTLWGCEFVTHGNQGLLRIYIDKLGDGEVDIDDCANVSRQLDLLLMVKERETRGYTLEVSSPGLDRKFFTIDQVLPYINRIIKFGLAHPIAGKRRFKGVVKDVNTVENYVIVEVDKESMNVPFHLIKVARLQVDF